MGEPNEESLYRPFGFLSVYGLVLASFDKSRNFVSYGRASSSRRIATFQGLGPYNAN